MAKEDRGFASMERNKQREIASKGGKAAHQKGTAHEWTSEEAREAGRKGGMASHRRKQEQQDEDGQAKSETIDDAEQMIGARRAALTEPDRPPSTGRRACRSRLRAAIIGSSCPFDAPRLVLGGRPTVGHMPLEHVIGVRIPASQPISQIPPFSLDNSSIHAAKTA